MFESDKRSGPAMTFRLPLIAVITLGLALSGFTAAFARPHSGAVGKPVSLDGIVTDSMCGVKHMMSGDDAKCIRSCIKNGSHFALVVDQKVYALSGKDEELDKLAGQKIALTGVMDVSDIIQVTAAKRDDSSASGGASASKSSQDAPATPENVSIEGLVRDVACPIQNVKATATEFNLKCALDCARLGSPLIILTKDGILYTPISTSMPDTDQRQLLMPFVGKYVRAKGQVFERAGAHAIAIQEIKEMKDVHLVTNAE
jgi:hypothetical protein